MRDDISRLREVGRLRRKLEWDGFPRLQMTLIVTITGGVGFLASYALLNLGLPEMWVRYLCAVAIAYLAFLFLLWLWLRTSASDYTEFPDLPDLVPSPRTPCDGPPTFSGKGGQFGGGGASGSFDDPAGAWESTAALCEDGGGIGDTLSAASEAEEFAIPLMAIILFAILLFSSFWIIYSAPILFAEMLVDGALAAGLYRRIRGLESRHWMEAALRRTWLPFMATAVLVSACGWAMSQYAPDAKSIGEVAAHVRQLG